MPEMTDADKQALAAARVLKEYCINTPCRACVIRGCEAEGTPPSAWDLPNDSEVQA